MLSKSWLTQYWVLTLMQFITSAQHDIYKYRVFGWGEIFHVE